MEKKKEGRNDIFFCSFFFLWGFMYQMTLLAKPHTAK